MSSARSRRRRRLLVSTASDGWSAAAAEGTSAGRTGDVVVGGSAVDDSGFGKTFADFPDVPFVTRVYVVVVGR